MQTRRFLDKKISISEKVADLPVEGQLLYTWLIPHADDLGLLQASPRTIKAQVIPMLDITTAKVKDLLDQMVMSGLLFIIKQDDKEFYGIKHFTENQKYRFDIAPQTILDFKHEKTSDQSWTKLKKLYEQLSNQSFHKEAVTDAERDVTDANHAGYPQQNTTKQNTTKLSSILIPEESNPPQIEKTNGNTLQIPENSDVKEVISFLEETLHTNIVTFGKQRKAYKMMQDAGYNNKQIKHTIKKMAADAYWSEKGFDLMVVANHIHEYKAKAERMLNKYG